MMTTNAKVGMLRLTNDVFIMAAYVSRVIAEQWDEGDASAGGTIYLYSLDGSCGTVERENDSMLPIPELVEVISRAVVQVARTGDDMDLRSRLLAPRY